MSYRKRFVVATAALTFLLTGCSSDSDVQEAPPVATLQSEAATAAASGGEQRPVYPIDATDDQIAAIVKPWTDCLRKEGVTKPEDAVSLLVQKEVTIQDLGGDGSEAEVAAWKACESRQPESAEQHQLRTNPTEYKDNQREMYRCAQAAGYKLTAPDPQTGQFGLTEVGPNGDVNSEKMQECRRQAFAN